jgi:hypothetical protein
MKDRYKIISVAELRYIKSIMTKAEIAFGEFRYFFFALAIYNLVSQILINLLRAYIYSERFQTIDRFRDIFVNNIIECIWKLILLVPVLVLIAIFRKRVIMRNQGISLWMFEIIAFVLVFCGSVLPFVATAVLAFYETAELFSIMTAAACMLICGVLTDRRKLRRMSYIYILIPMVVLTIFGTIHQYYEYSDIIFLYELLITYSYIKSIVYILYPSAGYCILALFMRRGGKGIDFDGL